MSIETRRDPTKPAEKPLSCLYTYMPADRPAGTCDIAVYCASRITLSAGLSLPGCSSAFRPPRGGAWPLGQLGPLADGAAGSERTGARSRAAGALILMPSATLLLNGPFALQAQSLGPSLACPAAPAHRPLPALARCPLPCRSPSATHTLAHPKGRCAVPHRSIRE